MLYSPMVVAHPPSITGVIPAHAFTGEGIQSDHVLVGSTGSDWDPGKDLSGSGVRAEVDLQ